MPENIWEILFPASFSTDLKCVRNAAFFQGCSFHCHTNSLPKIKLWEESTYRNCKTWAQRDAGNFKLYLLKLWLHVCFESAHDCTETREEHLQVPVCLAAASPLWGSLREPTKGKFPKSDVMCGGSELLLLPWFLLHCFSSCLLACAWLYFHKTILVIFLKKPLFCWHNFMSFKLIKLAHMKDLMSTQHCCKAGNRCREPGGKQELSPSAAGAMVTSWWISRNSTPRKEN